MESYWKSGRTRRLEFHHGQRFLFDAVEHGRSVTEALTFRSSPDTGQELSDPPEFVAMNEADLFVQQHHSVKHMVVSVGLAKHRVEDDEGRRTWSEMHRRLHLTIARGTKALQIDLDGPASLRTATELLQQLSSIDRSSAPLTAVWLTGLAAAAMNAFMAHHAPAGVLQHPRPATVDGRGLPIVATELRSRHWLNAYRPSYRFAAVFLPHDVASTPRGSTTHNAPHGVFCTLELASAEEVTVTVFLKEGGELQRRVRLVDLPARVLAAGTPDVWYPLGAGAWGQLMLLDLS